MLKNHLAIVRRGEIAHLNDRLRLPFNGHQTPK
jgi:hypothetical protein